MATTTLICHWMKGTPMKRTKITFPRIDWSRRPGSIFHGNICVALPSERDECRNICFCVVNRVLCQLPGSTCKNHNFVWLIWWIGISCILVLMRVEYVPIFKRCYFVAYGRNVAKFSVINFVAWIGLLHSIQIRLCILLSLSLHPSQFKCPDAYCACAGRCLAQSTAQYDCKPAKSNRSRAVTAVNPKCDWNAWLRAHLQHFFLHPIPSPIPSYFGSIRLIQTHFFSSFGSTFIFSNKSLKCFWCLVNVTRTKTLKWWFVGWIYTVHVCVCLCIWEGTDSDSDAQDIRLFPLNSLFVSSFECCNWHDMCHFNVTLKLFYNWKNESRVMCWAFDVEKII